MQSGNQRKDSKVDFEEVVIKPILAHRPKQAVVNSQALLFIDKITNAQQLLQVLSLLDDEGKKELLKKSKAAQWAHVYDDALAKASLKKQLLKKNGAPFPNECLKAQDKYFIMLYGEIGLLSHLYSNTQQVFLGNNKDSIKSQYMVAPLMWMSTDATFADKIAVNCINLVRDTEQMVQVSRLISNTESRIDYIKNWAAAWLPKTEGKAQKLAVLCTYLTNLIAALRGNYLVQNEVNTADQLRELTVALEIHGKIIETKEDMLAVQAAVKMLPGAEKLVFQHCKNKIDLPDENKIQVKKKLPDFNDIRLRRSFESRCFSVTDEDFARCRK